MNKTVAPLPPPRRALGRGLDALLPQAPAAAAAVFVNPTAIAEIPPSQIRPNPYQPRRNFAPAQLEELAQSIREQGLLQPIVVRHVAGGYELIAGERRLRAAQMLKLETIPALIRAPGSQQALEMAIIENLQRADLNPIEQAEAFARLATEFRLTQEQIGEKTGKDRASIANFLRLLRLEPAIREQIRTGLLNYGQARPLIGLSPEVQTYLAGKITTEEWPARRVEAYVARLGKPAPEAVPATPRDPNLRDAEERLARALGARVDIKTGKRARRGVISIAFHDLEEFQRLFDRLCQTEA